MKINRRYGIIRRELLRYVAAVSAIPSIAFRADESVVERSYFTENPFRIEVASSDPESNGVVLWARPAPQPLEGGGNLGTTLEKIIQRANASRWPKLLKNLRLSRCATVADRRHRPLVVHLHLHVGLGVRRHRREQHAVAQRLRGGRCCTNK